MISQTFVIVQVHMDRLVLTKSTESNHVFVRVEGYAVECSGVTKFRVDCNLATWEHKMASNLLGTNRISFKISNTNKQNIIPTCGCVPDICHPILTTREDKVPTWCESTIDPFSIVCGSSVLAYSQAERSKWKRKHETVTTVDLVMYHQSDCMISKNMQQYTVY